MKKQLSLTLIAAALVGFVSSPATADVLSNIEKNGQLTVGVKAKYKPYGFTNSDGKIIGMGPDLAKLVADELGVKLKLVPVVASNRMQFLAGGKVDLLIATMTDTAERRQVVQFVIPDYYASGVNIMARKSVDISSWKGLKGAPVCTIQGSFYNKKIEQEFGAKTIGFTGTTEALSALRQNRCVAFLYDDSFISSKLQDSNWSDFDMPLQSIDAQPWGIAVKKGADRFARFMSGMVVQWHTTGKLLQLQAKWGLKPLPFTTKMHELFRKMLPEGADVPDFSQTSTKTD